MSRHFLVKLEFYIEQERTKLSEEQFNEVSQNYLALNKLQIKFVEQSKGFNKWSNELASRALKLIALSKISEIYSTGLAQDGIRYNRWFAQLLKWHESGLKLSELQKEMEQDKMIISRLQGAKLEITKLLEE